MTLDIKIRREVDKVQGQLVELAEELINSSKGIWNDKKNGLPEAQFRNVSMVASSSECLAVVTNFIKYQIGRSTKKDKEWNLPTTKDVKGIPANTKFGMAVIRLLNEQIKNRLAKRINGAEADEDMAEYVAMELCRAFWGYVIRYNKFKKEGN